MLEAGASDDHTQIIIAKNLVRRRSGKYVFMKNLSRLYYRVGDYSPDGQRPMVNERESSLTCEVESAEIGDGRDIQNKG